MIGNSLRSQRFTSHCLGMTLLEVLIALAILLMSLAVISELLRIGSRAAVDARIDAQAALRAEAVMNEVVGGVHLMQDMELTPFLDDPDWKWSLVVLEGPHADLLRLEVTVSYQPDGDLPRRPLTLVRLARDPAIFAGATKGGL
ncbi:MAG: type II secretion system protein [Planctomycetaceae bacterium]